MQRYFLFIFFTQRSGFTLIYLRYDKKQEDSKSNFPNLLAHEKETINQFKQKVCCDAYTATSFVMVFPIR
jgi:hypothetical protein